MPPSSSPSLLESAASATYFLPWSLPMRKNKIYNKRMTKSSGFDTILMVCCRRLRPFAFLIPDRRCGVEAQVVAGVISVLSMHA